MKNKQLSNDAFFDKQKAKVNIVAEIFDNSYLLEDSIIKRALPLLKRLKDSTICMLKNRIVELKTVHYMISKTATK